MFAKELNPILILDNACLIQIALLTRNANPILRDKPRNIIIIILKVLGNIIKSLRIDFLTLVHVHTTAWHLIVIKVALWHPINS